MKTASITATINTLETESSTLHKIDSIVSVYGGDSKILKGGLPYIRQYITEDVRKDALILVPVALFLMLLILKISLGNWKNVAVPFSVVVLAVAISMGLIPLFGWKLSMIIILVPIILIAVANNYGIYLVARYQELGQKNKTNSKTGIISELLGSLRMPILFSGLTTVPVSATGHSIIPGMLVFLQV